MIATTEPRSHPPVPVSPSIPALVPLETTDPNAIIYPYSDGEPLAETQQHVLAILMTLALLRIYLQDQPAVVFSNQFFYYIEHQPKARVAPDVMVVFHIPKQLYASYKLWEGKQRPSIIFEMTSGGTKESDWGFKKTLYEQLGVTEYWLFDPYGDWIPQQLQGFRLDEMGVYQLIPDNCSQVLQLQLRAADYLLEFYRLDNGEKLLTPEELYQAAQSAYQLAQEAHQQAEQALQKAEEANQQAEEERQKAEAANQRAEMANQLAAQEKAKADRLAEKLRQLGIALEEDRL